MLNYVIIVLVTLFLLIGIAMFISKFLNFHFHTSILISGILISALMTLSFKVPINYNLLTVSSIETLAYPTNKWSNKHINYYIKKANNITYIDNLIGYMKYDKETNTLVIYAPKPRHSEIKTYCDNIKSNLD